MPGVRAMEPGRKAPTGITAGRRSSAQKRAKTSRASGPEIASAAYAVVTSTTAAVPAVCSSRARNAAVSPDGQIASVRPRVTGHHHVSPSRIAVPRSSAMPSAAGDP